MMVHQLIHSKNTSETESFAQSLAKSILDEFPNKTVVIFFSGNLGSGKTTFVKAFGQAIGVKENITSPTFVGQNEYYSGKIPLIHIDAYQSMIDYQDLHEIIELSHAKVIAIEWTENLNQEFIQKLKEDLSVKALEIKIEFDLNNENQRNIIVHDVAD